MTDRQVLIPDARHPITISPAPGTVRVTAGDTVVAVTDAALVLQESSYPPVYYIPRDAVGADLLTASAHTTYCPYKGVAHYHGLRTDADTLRDNKVWYYDEPHAAVSEIAGHVAFYPDVVDIELVAGAPNRQR
ncbi:MULTISPECIES: DUF427 domain-containing protein [unclassified Gordonia (in: high G+C Gram-positive bacteria)]|uniref:DUF427 domain-containing protein n=1 Tax=unclassified Gordonia (in: high G+C Gram-positive bacteria) TaxID=2657482 RepID=UPI001F0E3DC3|nr:DUF427 domain-containing protein [Gordonia sp. ABSL49_1]MCH5644591.1 DUF427 domain-containing protein [Gordonia sp. ABSL49_1]